MKHGKIYSKNRYFKAGDVIKWTPAYPSSTDVESRGLGIVINSKGSKFEAYWIGDGKVREADAFLPGCYVLQDVAPIPQVKEYIDNIRREFI